jgi:hypothetical protein
MHKEQGSTKIPSQQPESTGGSNRAVLDLTDEINGKTFLLRPLLRLMLEQVENGFSYNPEQAEAIDTLHTLIHSAQAYLTDIKKLCEDVQLAEPKGCSSQSNVDPLDRWIRITPETLPEHEQPVQVWCETWGRAEPVFYESKHGYWCRLFDNGSTLFEVEAPKYYRVGSRPPVEKGGAK